MKKIKRKKHRGKKQRRLALIVSCVTMVCAALLVSSVWSHDQRRKWQKAAQESSGTSSAPLETENAETPVPVREPAKPTPKPEDPTKQIYTYLQGPKSWNMGLDWSGEWGESFMDGGSFGGFGCGLCCMANIYSTLSKGECSPVDMYRYVKKHRLWWRNGDRLGLYEAGTHIAWNPMSCRTETGDLPAVPEPDKALQVCDRTGVQCRFHSSLEKYAGALCDDL